MLAPRAPATEGTAAHCPWKKSAPARLTWRNVQSQHAWKRKQRRPCKVKQACLINETYVKQQLHPHHHHVKNPFVVIIQSKPGNKLSTVSKPSPRKNMQRTLHINVHEDNLDPGSIVLLCILPCGAFGQSEEGPGSQLTPEYSWYIQMFNLKRIESHRADSGRTGHRPPYCQEADCCASPSPRPLAITASISNHRKT